MFVRCLHRTHSKRSHALGETDRESQRASEREREQRIIIGAIAIARRMSPSCSTSRIANARKMVHLLENNDFASGACGVRGGALARSLAACARAWTQHSSIKTVRTRYLCRNDTNILFLFGRARHGDAVSLCDIIYLEIYYTYRRERCGAVRRAEPCTGARIVIIITRQNGGLCKSRAFNWSAHLIGVCAHAHTHTLHLNR